MRNWIVLREFPLMMLTYQSLETRHQMQIDTDQPDNVQWRGSWNIGSNSTN